MCFVVLQGSPQVRESREDYFGTRTPLQTAIYQEDLEMVDILLAHGADPYAQRDVCVSRNM